MQKDPQARVYYYKRDIYILCMPVMKFAALQEAVTIQLRRKIKLGGFDYD